MTGEISQAEKGAAIVGVLAVVLYPLAPWLYALPLLLFLLLCLVAPFCPQWSWFLPIISKSQTGSSGVALTFDDGPSPLSTPFILELLAQYNYQATFFVIGEKAERYPELIRDILAQSHTVANHSWDHDNLLMLRSRAKLQKDIQKSQQLLRIHGIKPLVFRPPAGITNPRLKSVLQEEGLQAVTFSCRAFDGGNRKVKNLAGRILKKLQPGDIVLLHDLPPTTEEDVQNLKDELILLFFTLSQKNVKIQRLEKVIGSPVMSIL